MIPELGQFALALALGVSLLAGMYPLWGAARGQEAWMALARPLTYWQLALVSLAFGCLLLAFWHNDFSLLYVAEHSNRALPWYYRLAAVWGGHEGSMLLWVLILGGWSAAVAWRSRALPQALLARVLAILNGLSAGFLCFVLFTSNPFQRTFPDFPVDGQQLNPLLQDPGLILHPPLLYMGYVGFSVVFAFALAALLEGHLDAVWSRWARPWTLAAWSFLTLGITLGSWWAYYELGWGGWWFWDPVENASFMPWLAGTALLHSLAVTEKRASFKAWSLLLAILTFSLSLLGTFLVRSGILVSVHAFATDPTRGLYVLAFLLVVVGASLLLFALRGRRIRSLGRYELWSRESLLLTNNLLLVAGLLVVLLGTLLPLIHKQLGLGSISIGTPFFNQLFAWLGLPLGLLLGLGPLFRWRRQAWRPLLPPLLGTLLLSLLLGLALCLWLGEVKPWALTGFSLAAWIALCCLLETWLRASHSQPVLIGVRKLGRSHWAMILGHLGCASLLLGIAGVQNYSVERNVRMAPGERLSLAGHEFRFESLSEAQGPNYASQRAHFRVRQPDGSERQLLAEKRRYGSGSMPMTEAAIDASLGRDLYVALGEPLAGNSWALRLYYKPLVRWIWLAGLLMALGGALAFCDGRYRLWPVASTDTNPGGAARR